MVLEAKFKRENIRKKEKKKLGEQKKKKTRKMIEKETL